MTKEQLQSILDKMIQNPKSKNFMNHLVRSYTPISNVKIVTEKPENDFKCTLTRQSLVSFDELLTTVNDETTKQNLLEQVKNTMEEKIFDDFESKNNPIVEIIGDKRLGVVGKQTNTFMSHTAFQIFYEWVLAKTLNGDKHINWLLTSIRRENKETQPKKQNSVSENKKSKTATFKLGDTNSALESFKQKLLKEGK